MTDIKKPRRLFRDAGLAFPTIPKKLAPQMKEHPPWLFSTRQIEMSPYNLQHYVHEAERSQVQDYAVLCHSGHGVNPYAIQYYLVQGSLCMFLHLGWGGVYMDAEAAAEQIRDCFWIADQIVKAAKTVGTFQAGSGLTVVASHFYGSYWLPPGGIRQGEDAGCKDPLDVKPLEALTEALGWLKSH